MVSVHHRHDCTECLSSESKHCPQAALQSLYTTRYACRKIQVWREWFCPNYNKIFFVYAKLVALCSALFVPVKIFIRKLPQIQLNPNLIHLLSNLMCHSLPPKIKEIVFETHKSNQEYSNSSNNPWLNLNFNLQILELTGSPFQLWLLSLSLWTVVEPSSSSTFQSLGAASVESRYLSTAATQVASRRKTTGVRYFLFGFLV